MTRINCIPVSELANKHLVAEYRELPRVFGMMRRAIKAKREYKIPPSYRLNTGHMTFFVDKGAYLLRRQRELVAEMQRRGMNPQFTDPDALVAGLPAEYMGDWEPDGAAMALSRERIDERLQHMGTKPSNRRMTNGTAHHQKAA